MFVSIGVSILRLPLRLLRPLIVAPVGYFLWSHRMTTLSLNSVWGLPLLFLGAELTYYWMQGRQKLVANRRKAQQGFHTP